MLAADTAHRAMLHESWEPFSVAGSDECKTKAAEMLRLAQSAMRHEDKQFYLSLAQRWHALGARRDLESDAKRKP